MSSIKFDHTVDVLIIGSGNGAMTAAICVADMSRESSKELSKGVSSKDSEKNILIVEKADKVGGTSGLSGGGIWVPNNRYAKAAGAEDSFAEAKEYLRQTIPDGSVPEKMIDTYLINAPKVIDYLHEHAGLRYLSLEKYPDYYTDRSGAKEGHRSIEPEPISMKILGKDEKEFHESCCCMFDRISITQVEAQQLLAGHMKEWIQVAGKLMLKHYLDIPWVFTHKQSSRAAVGLAGIVRLWQALQKRRIPIWKQTAFQELIVEGDKVVGAVVEKEGKLLRIKANDAVILAAGGFEKNQQMREQYLPKPTNTEWSAGCKTNTGDAIRAGIAVGAKTHLMENAWWCTTLCIPGKEFPWPSIMPKSLPGTITVNKQGRRFSNESQNYISFLKESYAKHTEENPCMPAYMVFDNNFKKRYPAYPLMVPNWMIPKSYLQSGFAAYGNTIEELADKLGIDAVGLKETTERFNQFAKTGKDLDFARGDVAYDRYYGDVEVKPNPCLGPIQQAPFYAMKMQPGDLGTQGGMVINEHAQVMDRNNEIIEGLYACGNCAAAVLPTYPGPGSTLGPAMAFAYQAAKHITAWTEEA